MYERLCGPGERQDRIHRGRKRIDAADDRAARRHETKIRLYRGRESMIVGLRNYARALAVAGAVFGAVSANAASPDARALIGQYCEQCHQVKGVQNFGNVGPSLVDLKDRYPERKDVAEIISDETM